jgi:WD40 repeat protein
MAQSRELSRQQQRQELDEQALNEILQRPKFQLVNPVTATRRALARRKVKEERRLLRREELMKQDAERYLMELEERATWIAYELKERNLSRMIKEENIRYLIRKDNKDEQNRLIQLEKEEGLSYFRGQITEYRRWQNSAAKHYDLNGHEGPVSSVKLSSCLKYIASCSNDKTVKIWSLKAGKCLLTLSGHKKKVNDVDLHPNFGIDSEDICIVSCSSDCTINLWNCVNPKPLKVCLFLDPYPLILSHPSLSLSPVSLCLSLSVCLSHPLYPLYPLSLPSSLCLCLSPSLCLSINQTISGHTEAVYKCSFSSDGRRIVSCSEDQTARIWCLPEGYLLFVFKAHLSPVSTAKFSPTGRSEIHLPPLSLCFVCSSLLLSHSPHLMNLLPSPSS